MAQTLTCALPAVIAVHRARWAGSLETTFMHADMARGFRTPKMDTCQHHPSIARPITLANASRICRPSAQARAINFETTMSCSMT